MLSRARAIVFLILLSLAGTARGETVAEASISATQVGTGEPFQLSVQVGTDQKDDKLPWPQVENLGNFQVGKNSSTSSSSQTTIINGKVSQRTQFVTNFIYTLTAKTPGTFQVGPIRYTYKGFDRVLGSASVTVIKQETALTTVPSVSKKNPWLGEQLLYNLRIIPSPTVQQINLPQDLQKLIGEKFWFQRLDKNIEAKVVSINGQNTRVFDVRIVLFPLLTGAVELSGIPVEYQQLSQTQQRRQNSIFDMFDAAMGGGGAVVNMTTLANPLSLTVSPLPPGAPADFTGSVGEYGLSASIDKTSLPSGDALTLTIAIHGDGQPKTITKPTLPDLSAFEVFEPEVAVGSQTRGSTLITTKTFKYVMVPHRKGDYTIGPVTFSYFHPGRRAYEEARSAPIAVSVTQGKETTSSSIGAGGQAQAQREITDIGADIRHIKIDAAPLSNENDYLYKTVWFWLLFSSSPLAFGGALFQRRRSLKLASDSALKRKTMAGTQLRKRLREAEEALQRKSAAEFYRALSQAVVGFVSDKLNVEFRGLTIEEGKSRLRDSGLAEAAAGEYEKILQQCDFGQFAGGSRDEQAWKAALTNAENLLKKLDREL